MKYKIWHLDRWFEVYVDETDWQHPVATHSSLEEITLTSTDQLDSEQKIIIKKLLENLPINYLDGYPIYINSINDISSVISSAQHYSIHYWHHLNGPGKIELNDITLTATRDAKINNKTTCIQDAKWQVQFCKQSLIWLIYKATLDKTNLLLPNNENIHLKEFLLPFNQLESELIRNNANILLNAYKKYEAVPLKEFHTIINEFLTKSPTVRKAVLYLYKSCPHDLHEDFIYHEETEQFILQPAILKKEFACELTTPGNTCVNDAKEHIAHLIYTAAIQLSKHHRNKLKTAFQPFLPTDDIVLVNDSNELVSYDLFIEAFKKISLRTIFEKINASLTNKELYWNFSKSPFEEALHQIEAVYKHGLQYQIYFAFNNHQFHFSENLLDVEYQLLDRKLGDNVSAYRFKLNRQQFSPTEQLAFIKKTLYSQAKQLNAAIPDFTNDSLKKIVEILSHHLKASDINTLSSLTEYIQITQSGYLTKENIFQFPQDVVELEINSLAIAVSTQGLNSSNSKSSKSISNSSSSDSYPSLSNSNDNSRQTTTTTTTLKPHRPHKRKKINTAQKEELSLTAVSDNQWLLFNAKVKIYKALLIALNHKKITDTDKQKIRQKIPCISEPNQELGQLLLVQTDLVTLRNSINELILTSQAKAKLSEIFVSNGLEKIFIGNGNDKGKLIFRTDYDKLSEQGTHLNRSEVETLLSFTEHKSIIETNIHNIIDEFKHHDNDFDETILHDYIEAEINQLPNVKHIIATIINNTLNYNTKTLGYLTEKLTTCNKRIEHINNYLSDTNNITKVINYLALLNQLAQLTNQLSLSPTKHTAGLYELFTDALSIEKVTAIKDEITTLETKVTQIAHYQSLLKKRGDVAIKLSSLDKNFTPSQDEPGLAHEHFTPERISAIHAEISGNKQQIKHIKQQRQFITDIPSLRTQLESLVESKKSIIKTVLGSTSVKTLDTQYLPSETQIKKLEKTKTQLNDYQHKTEKYARMFDQFIDDAYRLLNEENERARIVIEKAIKQLQHYKNYAIHFQSTCTKLNEQTQAINKLNAKRQDIAKSSLITLEKMKDEIKPFTLLPTLVFDGNAANEPILQEAYALQQSFNESLEKITQLTSRMTSSYQTLTKNGYLDEATILIQQHYFNDADAQVKTLLASINIETYKEKINAANQYFNDKLACLNQLQALDKTATSLIQRLNTLPSVTSLIPGYLLESSKKIPDVETFKIALYQEIDAIQRQISAAIIHSDTTGINTEELVNKLTVLNNEISKYCANVNQLNENIHQINSLANEAFTKLQSSLQQLTDELIQQIILQPTEILPPWAIVSTNHYKQLLTQYRHIQKDLQTFSLNNKMSDLIEDFYQTQIHPDQLLEKITEFDVSFRTSQRKLLESIQQLNADIKNAPTKVIQESVDLAHLYNQINQDVIAYNKQFKPKISLTPIKESDSPRAASTDQQRCDALQKLFDSASRRLAKIDPEQHAQQHQALSTIIAACNPNPLNRVIAYQQQVTASAQGLQNHQAQSGKSSNPSHKTHTHRSTLIPHHSTSKRLARISSDDSPNNLTAFTTQSGGNEDNHVQRKVTIAQHSELNFSWWDKYGGAVWGCLAIVGGGLFITAGILIPPLLIPLVSAGVASIGIGGKMIMSHSKVESIKESIEKEIQEEIENQHECLDEPIDLNFNNTNMHRQLKVTSSSRGSTNASQPRELVDVTSIPSSSPPYTQQANILKLFPNPLSNNNTSNLQQPSQKRGEQHVSQQRR